MNPKFVTAVLTASAGTALAALLAATPAYAAPTHSPGRDGGAVFVQNDRLAGNQVVAYARNSQGALTQLAAYETGGLGGRLDGAAVDFTASQGALAIDAHHRTLYAVNPGSDTLTSFAVDRSALRRRDIVGTHGSFPVSVAVSGDRVFVLNARDGGSVQGYVAEHGRLHAVRAWHRDLGLPVTTGAAEFTHTPGQVGFTPDGTHLIVTTKAATNSILTWTFGRDGRLSGTPVVDTEAGTVPFSFTFDRSGRLQLTQAGTNAVATYRVGRDGTLTPLGTTPTGQRATCWITADGDLLVASNAGSANVTTLAAHAGGAPAVLGNTGTGPGTVDADFSDGGRYLYVQSGGDGAVNVFAVGRDGTLTARGTVSVPDATGGEGIVAV